MGGGELRRKTERIQGCQHYLGRVCGCHVSVLMGALLWLGPVMAPFLSGTLPKPGWKNTQRAQVPMSICIIFEINSTWNMYILVIIIMMYYLCPPLLCVQTTHAHAHMYTHPHTHVHPPTHTCTPTHTHMYTHPHTHVHPPTHTCTPTHTHMYTHPHTHVHSEESPSFQSTFCEPSPLCFHVNEPRFKDHSFFKFTHKGVN